MFDTFSQAITYAAVGLALIIGVYVLLGRRPGRVVAGLFVIVELALIAQLAIGLIRLAEPGATGVPGWEFAGYLVATLLILPAGAVWAAGERSRAGTSVLVLAALTVAFLQVRLEQLWGLGG